MEESAQLSQIVILLCAAVLIVAVCRVARLSPVIGYLAAGTAIGPYGLKLIPDVGATTAIADFGVIFLLFLIGLELSLKRLRSMRKHVFEIGGAQVIITSLLFAGCALALGKEASTAIIIGCGLALSSTAIVLQVISEQGEQSSQVGRLALAILILQDLAVIPLFMLVSLSNMHDESLWITISEAMFKAGIGLAIIFIAGQLVLRPLFRFIASLDNPELFTATTLLMVLGVSWLTTLAGLSPALGAFMAGLLMAETEFKPQIEADVLPFKGLFLGLFFMTVGMSLDITILQNSFVYIIAITAALMTFKAAIIIGLIRIFRFNMATSIHTGLLLSQGSEFSFILFALAVDHGLLLNSTEQILLAAVTLSMAITPLAAHIGKKIAMTLEKKSAHHPGLLIDETLDLRQHVIISGFGRVGHTVAQLLEVEQINYVAIDMDSMLVARERKRGTPVYYGDTSRLHVLAALGITRARAVIITHNDTRVALQTISTIRETNQDIPILARAKNIEQIQKYEAAGATLAISEMFETSLQMGAALLKSLNVGDSEISRILDIFRAEDYAITRACEKDAAGA